MASKVCVLGLGKMGTAMALRLRETGHAVSVWNRSPAKAEAVRAALLPGDCAVGACAAAALSSSASDSVVVLVLSNTAACLDVIEQTREQLRGRTVVNLTSGNPDEGRQIAAAVAGLGVHTYLDAAYCGPPTKARQGAGVLFLSCDTPAEAERVRPVLSELGEYAFCGDVGSSKAIDYAVVDLVGCCALSASD
jgi:3-hydroxyisobutyrate dehydrogenase-like beta-hydroxyacid dehydrogenase